jgi:hypothetical protein
MMKSLDRPSTPSLSLSTPDAVQAADSTRVPSPVPEPTALPKELHAPDESPELSRWVDRRGDLLPVKRGPTWYTPRYGLSDADRVPVGGRRQAT